MHGLRAAIPQTSSLASAEFATIRERLIKIGARVIEHIARIRIQLPTSCPGGGAVPRRSAWLDAVRPLTLQLSFRFEVRALSGSLVSPAPE